MTLLDLERRVTELEQQLGELERQDVPEWHFELFSDLVNWFGAAKTDADNGVLDLSSIFGIPAKVRAVMIRTDVKDAGITSIRIGDNSGGGDFLAYTGYGSTHDEWVVNQGVIPCDANGDIWLTIDAGKTINMSLFVLAYYI